MIELSSALCGIARPSVGNHVLYDALWRSRKLARCSREAAAWYGWIFLVCDEWGRFEYRPNLIWSLVFAPRKDFAPDTTPTVEEVSVWLSEYEREGVLIRYHYEGELAVWTNFKGRAPAKRRKSTLPDPRPFPEYKERLKAITEGDRKATGRGPEASGKAPGRPTGATSKRLEQEQETRAGGPEGQPPPLGIRIPPPSDPSPVDMAILAACREIADMTGKDESEVLKAHSMIPPGRGYERPTWIVSLDAAKESWKIRTHQDLQAELSRLKAPPVEADPETHEGLPTRGPWENA